MSSRVVPAAFHTASAAAARTALMASIRSATCTEPTTQQGRGRRCIRSDGCCQNLSDCSRSATVVPMWSASVHSECHQAMIDDQARPYG